MKLVFHLFVLFHSVLRLGFAQPPPIGEVKLVMVFHRHGSRVPGVIDARRAHFWEGLVAGDLTQVGCREMNTLGQILRDNYVSVGLIPEQYDEYVVHARASSANEFRTLQSTECLTRSLYPGEEVPFAIETYDANVDIVLHPTGVCPSYDIEQARILREYEQEIVENDPELVERTRNITEFDPTMDPLDLIFWARDNVQSQEAHGYPVDDELMEVFPQLLEIYNERYERLLTQDGDFDPRGSLGGAMGELIIENIQSTIDGSNSQKLFAYGGHAITMTALFDVLNLKHQEFELGGALILELRESEGEHFVNGFWAVPQDIGTDYTFTQQTLFCPNESYQCAVDAFFSAVRVRIGPGTDVGCCLRGRGFFDFRCNDYLNPNVLDILQCRRYREKCPATSCGNGQILDASTLLCVQVV